MFDSPLFFLITGSLGIETKVGKNMLIIKIQNIARRCTLEELQHCMSENDSEMGRAIHKRLSRWRHTQVAFRRWCSGGGVQMAGDTTAGPVSLAVPSLSFTLIFIHISIFD